MRAIKGTDKLLGFIPVGNQNIANPRFRLGSCSLPGHCVRSYETGWTRAKVEQLHAWIDKQEAVPRTAEELDALLRRAGEELGHGNATPAGKQRAHKSRMYGAGHWHRPFAWAELMGAGGPGYVVVPELIPKTDCAVLRQAAKGLFRSGLLHGIRKRKRAGSRRPPSLRGALVHAERVGGATLRSLARAALPDLPADAKGAWDRTVQAVSAEAEHKASSDEALNLCAHGMAEQELHQDSTASLAYVVMLSDQGEATQFVELDEEWLDVMATSKTKRKAFLRRAWDEARKPAAIGKRRRLQAGDVLFFYTQRIHRAPPPPPEGSPRYTLFGAFCKRGLTEDTPLYHDTWEERWDTAGY